MEGSDFYGIYSVQGIWSQTVVGLNLCFAIRKKLSELGQMTDVFSSVKIKPEIMMPTLEGGCEALNEITCEKIIWHASRHIVGAHDVLVSFLLVWIKA